MYDCRSREHPGSGGGPSARDAQQRTSHPDFIGFRLALPGLKFVSLGRDDDAEYKAGDGASNGNKPMADNADVPQLTFEKALAELETIVQKLERGDVALEESVAIYERGEALKRRCEELLRQAEARVEKITLDSSGKPTGTEPLDVG